MLLFVVTKSVNREGSLWFMIMRDGVSHFFLLKFL